MEQASEGNVDPEQLKNIAKIQRKYMRQGNVVSIEEQPSFEEQSHNTSMRSNILSSTIILNPSSNELSPSTFEE